MAKSKDERTYIRVCSVRREKGCIKRLFRSSVAAHRAGEKKFGSGGYTLSVGFDWMRRKR
jgi:hypothetical protein